MGSTMRVLVPAVPGFAGDGVLLARFLNSRDEAAFATLVQRHAAMVFGTCYRVLGNHADTEDALQATFVVLARRAAAFTDRDCVGGFLHGVAYHSALKVKAMAAKRRQREAQAPTPQPSDRDTDALAILDEELAPLPSKYRDVVVLCELEGLSRRETAERLDIPEGTISSRLATAHQLLHKRLSARGLGAVSTTVLLADVVAAIPHAITQSAVKAAMQGPKAEIVPVVSHISRMLFLNKLRLGAVAIGVMLVMVGVGYPLLQAANQGVESKPMPLPVVIPTTGEALVQQPLETQPVPGSRMNRERMLRELRALGLAYHAYYDAKQKGPASASELLSYLNSDEGKDSRVNGVNYQLLQTGAIVLNPSVPIRSIRDLTSVIILYEKTLPEQPRWVILGDGNPREVSAAEFTNLLRQQSVSSTNKQPTPQ